MAERAERLPLRADDLPDITDAGVGLTLMMISTLMEHGERRALNLQLAAAIESGDRAGEAALHRRLAAVPPAVARMADVARAGIDRFDSGMADPQASDPSSDARARRALVKSVNWLDRRFWPMYGTVRPVVPPASDTPPPVGIEPTRAAPSCGELKSERLRQYDHELLRMQSDDRPSALTARRIMTADRNAMSAACRDCGGCAVGAGDLTRPLPLL